MEELNIIHNYKIQLEYCLILTFEYYLLIFGKKLIYFFDFKSAKYFKRTYHFLAKFFSSALNIIKAVPL